MPIMAPKPVIWVSCCVMFRFLVFIMVSIKWLYETQGLFKICDLSQMWPSILLIRKCISLSHKMCSAAVSPSSIDATLIMSCRSFPAFELCSSSASGEAHRWPNFRFIHLASHPPSCFPSLLVICIQWKLFLFFSILFFFYLCLKLS